MANQTVVTAVCKCTMGDVPAMLQVTSQSTVMACSQLAATIQDNVFPSFGMCKNPANPAVASATAAAMGVPTPMPCVPAVIAPWMPGAPTVMICGKPALNSTSKVPCSYPGGIIDISLPMGLTVELP